MVIFDSVLKKKVEFIPQDPQNVKIYVCGPTVYDDAHLGHAKSSVSFDLLRRNNRLYKRARKTKFHIHAKRWRIF